MKISPSILAGNLANLEEELSKLSEADLLHIDIMDGHYVPNLTFGLPILKNIRAISDIPFDVHLMVTNPSFYIDQLAELGGVEYISWHPETEYHNHRLIAKIQGYGIKAGWAINPAVSVDIIDPVIEYLDFVLLMSVNPGFSGQSFITNVYQKIRMIKKKEKVRPNHLDIQVDGGVNHTNAHKLQEAGATILVAGAYIFKSDDYSRAIQNLKFPSKEINK